MNIIELVDDKIEVRKLTASEILAMVLAASDKTPENYAGGLKQQAGFEDQEPECPF